jgi:hypothetical protein
MCLFHQIRSPADFPREGLDRLGGTEALAIKSQAVESSQIC